MSATDEEKERAVRAQLDAGYPLSHLRRVAYESWVWYVARAIKKHRSVPLAARELGVSRRSIERWLDPVGQWASLSLQRAVQGVRLEGPGAPSFPHPGRPHERLHPSFGTAPKRKTSSR